MKTRKPIYKLLLLLALIGSGTSGFSQVSTSVYFMDHLPAANSLNPSFNPQNNFYIDLPLISSLYFSTELPFTYSQFTQRNVDDDKLYIDKTGIINSMDEVGSLSFELSTVLLRSGIKYRQHFINFSVAKVFASDISLERDLLGFMLFGNGNEANLGKQLTFSKTGFKASFYNEFAMGWSTRFSDKFTAGIKLKYLNGVLNAWSEKAELNVFTDPENNYALSVSTDLLIHTSATKGYLEDLDFDNPTEYLMVKFSSNHGFAGDIGLSYRPVEKLQLSASVVDLGMISWKENVKSYQSKYPDKTFTFEGFDMSHLINGGAVSDSIAILDSLDEHFSIETIYENYTAYLTPKAYLGVAYNVSKNDQFGLLIKGKFPENNFLTSYTLNYRRTFGDVFAAFVNYTFKKNFNHIGFGFSVRAGSVMLYAMNDMVDSLFEPTQAKGYNVQFGISLMFGKPNRDKVPPKEENEIPDGSGLDTSSLDDIE